jgi:hypothetical protein
MQPLPLNQRLDLIAQHLVRARLFLDLWFYFEERDSRRKIIETMREYNEFFLFTPHAYFVAYIIYMAGVFDKRRGTISLCSLVREVKAAGQLKGQEAAAVDALLFGAEPIAEKVLTLRHMAFAHRSAHTSYDDVFKMAAVKPKQLRDLTDIALKIVNRLLLARGLRDQEFTQLPLEAAEAMMKALGGEHVEAVVNQVSHAKLAHVAERHRRVLLIRRHGGLNRSASRCYVGSSFLIFCRSLSRQRSGKSTPPTMKAVKVISNRQTLRHAPRQMPIILRPRRSR